MSAHLRDIRQSVVTAIEAARTVPVVARDGLIGGFRGATSKDVLKRGLEVLDEPVPEPSQPSAPEVVAAAMAPQPPLRKTNAAPEKSLEERIRERMLKSKLNTGGAVQAFERVATLVKASEAGHVLDMDTIRLVLRGTIDVVLYMEDRRVVELFYDPMFARSAASAS